jgi:predicted TIM-barrel fold metal-dependent hydrolase
MPLNHHKEAWRQMADCGDSMQDRQWREGFALLSRHGLVFDLQMYAHQGPDAFALARRYTRDDDPRLVQHLAWLVDLSLAGFKRWSQHLTFLAECPNVFIKLSGIGCAFRRSGPDLVRRYLRQAVATLAADRCMFASNCPSGTAVFRRPHPERSAV